MSKQFPSFAEIMNSNATSVNNIDIERDTWKEVNTTATRGNKKDRKQMLKYKFCNYFFEKI